MWLHKELNSCHKCSWLSFSTSAQFFLGKHSHFLIKGIELWKDFLMEDWLNCGHWIQKKWLFYIFPSSSLGHFKVTERPCKDSKKVWIELLTSFHVFLSYCRPAYLFHNQFLLSYRSCHGTGKIQFKWSITEQISDKVLESF